MITAKRTAETNNEMLAKMFGWKQDSSEFDVWLAIEYDPEQGEDIWKEKNPSNDLNDFAEAFKVICEQNPKVSKNYFDALCDLWESLSKNFESFNWFTKIIETIPPEVKTNALVEACIHLEIIKS